MLTGTQSSGNLSLTGIHRPNSGFLATVLMHSIISLLLSAPQLIRHLSESLKRVAAHMLARACHPLADLCCTLASLLTVSMHLSCPLYSSIVTGTTAATS